MLGEEGHRAPCAKRAWGERSVGGPRGEWEIEVIIGMETEAMGPSTLPHSSCLSFYLPFFSYQIRPQALSRQPTPQTLFYL